MICFSEAVSGSFLTTFNTPVPSTTTTTTTPIYSTIQQPTSIIYNLTVGIGDVLCDFLTSCRVILLYTDTHLVESFSGIQSSTITFNSTVPSFRDKFEEVCPTGSIVVGIAFEFTFFDAREWE